MFKWKRTIERLRAVQAFSAFFLSVSRTPPRRGRAHIKERQVKALRALSSENVVAIQNAEYQQEANQPPHDCFWYYRGRKGDEPQSFFLQRFYTADQPYGRPIPASTVLWLVDGAFGRGASLLRRRLVSWARIEG